MIILIIVRLSKNNTIATQCIRVVGGKVGTSFLKIKYVIEMRGIEKLKQQIKKHQGKCPFCEPIKCSKNYAYFIHIDNLIKFKKSKSI